ncbi:hypothetical protein [Terrihalobacillus insolitus]|uniref:hypothetical protein n=1 Tax=Terrihalobacillus insolitus TaxID=2950438 RepID=UPI0023418763|nr:hypothetical protein [Terrihalobacillus insolitus]MDC3414260.1 hypothetical protein [Terrihalobacillus insolitus]
MSQENQVSNEHYQKVVGRLSQKIGALTVENTSLATANEDLQQENNQLKQKIEDNVKEDNAK